MVIRGLKQSEINSLKAEGIACVPDSHNMSKISKTEAEAIAMAYLVRGVQTFDQIKDLFTYSQQYNGESHEWIWKNKSYELPNGLAGDPYSYPIVRIVIYGDKSILYENTTSLFEN